MYIYHERQLGALCGVHCLNNLLQGPHLGPGDLAEIGVQLDQEESKLMRTSSGADEDHGFRRQRQPRQPHNVDSSADGGNFSIQVLTVALKRFKLELLPAKHPSAHELMKDPPKAAEAFICQYRDHWFSVREVADCWWNLNSTRKRPALVSPFYLAAWLVQLRAEGYSIFLVQGAKLPAPSKPRQQGKPEENFHEIFDLLEQGKRTGGNPLANDDIEEMAIPPGPPRRPITAATPQAVRSAPAAGSAQLLEMGFKEPQIRAALALSGGNHAQASNLLMHVRGVDAHVERCGVKLGRAIQEVVMGLERVPGDAVGDRVLQLVTLLSLDESHVQAAAAHVDMAVLTDALLAILAQRGQTWPAQAVEATSIAVELLVAEPCNPPIVHL